MTCDSVVFEMLPPDSIDIEFESNDHLNFGLDPIVIEGGTKTWTDILNKPFETIDDNTLKIESGVLKVNTTNEASADNTRPITSAGVNAIVGNIDTLLSLI